MTDSFKPRLSILPDAQRRLWPSLRPISERGFVLYGGTAIALQLGHRASVDFDFFSDRPFDPIQLATSLSLLVSGKVIQSEPNTLTVTVASPKEGPGVKLSFFGGLDRGRANPPLATEDGILRVASLDDLMATKLVVLQKRVEARDYQDLAALIQAGVSLSLGLGIARAMYGDVFQSSESLKAMIYFKGDGLEILTAAERTTLIDAVRTVDEIPAVRLIA